MAFGALALVMAASNVSEMKCASRAQAHVTDAESTISDPHYQRVAVLDQSTLDWMAQHGAAPQPPTQQPSATDGGYMPDGCNRVDWGGTIFAAFVWLGASSLAYVLGGFFWRPRRKS